MAKQDGAGRERRPADGSDGGSVLVTGAAGKRRLRTVLRAGRPRTERDAMVVVAGRTSPQRLWQGLKVAPEQLRFVDARPRERTVGHVEGRVAVHDPSTGLDLRAVGESTLDASEALAAAGATRPRVVVEDLSPLFTHGSFERVYRLLHVLIAHVEDNGGTLVAGIDPTEEDDRTGKVLGWLFGEHRTLG